MHRMHRILHRASGFFEVRIQNLSVMSIGDRFAVSEPLFTNMSRELGGRVSYS